MSACNSMLCPIRLSLDLGFVQANKVAKEAKAFQELLDAFVGEMFEVGIWNLFPPHMCPSRFWGRVDLGGFCQQPPLVSGTCAAGFRGLWGFCSFFWLFWGGLALLMRRNQPRCCCYLGAEYPTTVSSP